MCDIHLWMHVCICIGTYVCGNQRLTLNLFLIAPTHTLFFEAGCLAELVISASMAGQLALGYQISSM